MKVYWEAVEDYKNDVQSCLWDYGGIIEICLKRIDKLESFLLVKMAVGSCTCQTKSPEISQHSESCNYRQIMEILND